MIRSFTKSKLSNSHHLNVNRWISDRKQTQYRHLILWNKDNFILWNKMSILCLFTIGNRPHISGSALFLWNKKTGINCRLYYDVGFIIISYSWNLPDRLNLDTIQEYYRKCQRSSTLTINLALTINLLTLKLQYK